MKPKAHQKVLRASRRQKGFALLMTSLALIILSAVMSYTLYGEHDRMLDDKAAAQGGTMRTLGGIMNAYTTTYYQPLINGTAIAGVADPYNPTITELKSLNIGMPSAFAERAIVGGYYKLRVSLTPAGCTPPACNVEGLIWIDKPFRTESGTAVDNARLGLAVQKVGEDGAASRTESPSTLSGFGGQWSGTNPVSNTPGILAMRTGYASSSMSQFMRRDGSTKPTGNWDFDNKQIDNLGMIQIGNIVTQDTACTKNGQVSIDAQGALLSCQNFVWRGAKSRYWKDPVATFGALPGTDEVGVVRLTRDTNRAFAWTGLSWMALAVDQNGDITVPGITKTGKLLLGDIVVENSGCPQTGLVARTAAGVILSCQGGIWRREVLDIHSYGPYIVEGIWASQTIDLASHRFCALSEIGMWQSDNGCRVDNDGSGKWSLTLVTGAQSTATGFIHCSAVCFD